MMMQQMGRLACRAALAVALAAVWTSRTARIEAQAAGIAVGQVVKPIVVKDLDGKGVDLGRWIGKQPVLIEFWATWCGLCEQLLPKVKAAHATYGGKVAFLGVNITVNDPVRRVRKYLDEHRPPFVPLYDTDGTSARAFDVPTTSYVVILDRGGKVVYTGVGGDQKLDDALRRVTAGS